MFSLSKAELNFSTTARTAVLACGNPKFGKFNRKISIQENFNLTKAFESRFDLLFTLVDKPSVKKVALFSLKI